MISQEDRGIGVALAHRIGDDASAEQIAEAVVSTWQGIEAALSPVIGKRGVAALYERSLYLSGLSHPWLAATREGVQTTVDLPALKSALSQQSSANAAAAGGTLLQTVYELLASLIGPSLTERLLHPVWARLSSGLPAQDTTP